MNSGLPWPDPPRDAVYHGLAGHFVRRVAPYTEADPIAVLTGFLAAFGCAVGPGPYFRIGVAHHTPRLFVGCAGRTGAGRKTDSILATRAVFDRVASDMPVGGGLSTGEGLIYQVRDPTYGRDKDGREIITDPGVKDKRLFLIETEGARVLRVMRRDGNTLSHVIRESWDGHRLKVSTRNSPLQATGAHVALVLHIPTEELTREMSAVEGENGFANRFIWLLVQRSKELPEPEPFEGVIVNDLALMVAPRLAAAREIGRMQRDDVASGLWKYIYHDLSRARPGLSGRILGRAEAQVARLSMIYALLDGSATIRLPHLEAALALWVYAERSVLAIFGDATGDPVADGILRALRQQGQLDRTEIRDLLGRNVQVGRLEEALVLLRTNGKASSWTEETRGRPREVWTAEAVAASEELWSYVVPTETPKNGGFPPKNGGSPYDINDQSHSLEGYALTTYDKSPLAEPSFTSLVAVGAPAEDQE